MEKAGTNEKSKKISWKSMEQLPAAAHLKTMEKARNFHGKSKNISWKSMEKARNFMEKHGKSMERARNFMEKHGTILHAVKPI